VREGILLKLTDELGKVNWGEIAPISWFGSETLEQALEFCQQLPSEITQASLFSVPDRLPACQFGFESILKPQTSNLKIQSSKLSALLPAGNLVLNAWKAPWEAGHRTFKWKIGVDVQELELLEQLVGALPPTAKLRLDANGGLGVSAAREWLKMCDRLGIEFLEQPLSIDEFDAMLNLAAEYATPLALDESVATLAQLKTCYDAGWRGVFVIKPPSWVLQPRCGRSVRSRRSGCRCFRQRWRRRSTTVRLQLAGSVIQILSGADRYGTTHWFTRSVLPINSQIGQKILNSDGELPLSYLQASAPADDRLVGYDSHSFLS
jgi:o-succinylbenzoate synthase